MCVYRNAPNQKERNKSNYILKSPDFKYVWISTYSIYLSTFTVIYSASLHAPTPYFLSAKYSNRHSCDESTNAQPSMLVVFFSYWVNTWIGADTKEVRKTRHKNKRLFICILPLCSASFSITIAYISALFFLWYICTFSLYPFYCTHNQERKQFE